MKYLFVFLLISGCTLGNGQICGPQTPAAYCDKEAYEKLAHPKPYGTRWIKENGPDEQRLLDIKECGGNGVDVEFTFEQYQSFRDPTDKSDIPAFFRLRTAWGRCMALKGYHWE
ncbi:MAG: hypothetical protein EB015_21860 [Methylocystaceae bacterium]|nr:hypothetical protein [Methylocystaceae bacterium]